MYQQRQEQQLWEKERISLSTSNADIKGQNFSSAVYLVSCYIGDKGTGMMRVRLGAETLFDVELLCQEYCLKWSAIVAIVRCREGDE